MWANRFQVNQPELIFQAVAEQVKLPLTAKLDDAQGGQVALLAFAGIGVGGDVANRLVDIDGVPHLLTGEGNGPINAAVHALQSAGINVNVRSYEERSMVPMGEDGNARACAMVEVAGADGRDWFGIGIDSNIVTASLKAIISGINRVAVAAQPVQQAA